MVRNSRVEAGAGAMVMAMPTNINWGAFYHGGVMPYGGKARVSIRKVKTIEEGKSIGKLEIPTTYELTEQFNIGDKLIYTTHGGIMFNGGAGVTILAQAGAMYMVQGQWKTTIRKTNIDTFEVSYKKIKLDHFMVSVDTIVSSLGTGVFNSTDKAFTFEYNLSNENAWNAFKHALKGDLTLSQEFSKDSDNGITHLLSANSKSIGNMFNFSIGLPILWKYNYTSGKMFSHSQQDLISANFSIDSAISASFKEKKSSGVKSRHLTDKFDIVAMAQDFNKENLQYAASAKWFFEKDKLKVKSFKKKFLNKLNELGLKAHTLKFDIEKKNLGYTRSEININFTQKFFNQLKNTDYVFTRAERNPLYYNTTPFIIKKCQSNTNCLERSIRQLKITIRNFNKNLKAIKNEDYSSKKELTKKLQALSESILSSPEFFRQVLDKFQVKSFVLISGNIQGENFKNTDIRVEL